MQFDVVVGNPPYQNGDNKRFYREFVIRSFDLSCDVVVMITPANWASYADRDSRFLELIKSNGLETYRYLGRAAFDAEITTVYFICRRRSRSGLVRLVAETDSAVLPLQDLDHFPTRSVDIFGLMAKLTDPARPKLDARKGRLYRNQARTADPTIRCIWSVGPEGGELDWSWVDADHLDRGDLVGYGHHKVVMSRNTAVGKLGVLKHAGPDHAIANGTYGLVVESVLQAQNLMAYLESKLVRRVVAELKGSVISNSRAVLGAIPLVDLDRRWSDAELYQHFDLTPSEIRYVEGAPSEPISG